MSKASGILLNEAEDKFVTDVDVDVFGNPPGLPKDVHLAYQTKVDVKWSYSIDARSWGIKSFDIIIPDQEVAVTFIESTEDEDIEHEVIIKIKSAEYEVSPADKYTISSMQLLPITLEVNFAKDTQKLIFQLS